MRKRLWLCCFLLLALVVVFMPSCRSEPLAPLEPALTLLSPGYGSTLSAGPVEVRVYVQNFKLVDKTGQPNIFGEGHIIYYMDAEPPIKTGSSVVTGPGTYAVTIETSYTWTNVTPGQHTFAAQLVNNDETPLVSPVTQRVIVKVE